MKQRRVLILYATMTSNTEKVAKWFQEVFDAYNWEVNLVRIRNQRELAEQQDTSFVSAILESMLFFQGNLVILYSHIFIICYLLNFDI